MTKGFAPAEVSARQGLVFSSPAQVSSSKLAESLSENKFLRLRVKMFLLA